MTSVTAARVADSSASFLLGGEGGDEGGVVDGAGLAAAGVVDEGEGVVGEQGRRARRAAGGG
jgi:hypothetical protein